MQLYMEVRGFGVLRWEVAGWEVAAHEAREPRELWANVACEPREQQGGGWLKSIVAREAHEQQCLRATSHDRRVFFPEKN